MTKAELDELLNVDYAELVDALARHPELRQAIAAAMESTPLLPWDEFVRRYATDRERADD